jgi:hypothetical protein
MRRVNTAKRYQNPAKLHVRAMCSTTVYLGVQVAQELLYNVCSQWQSLATLAYRHHHQDPMIKSTPQRLQHHAKPQTQVASRQHSTMTARSAMLGTSVLEQRRAHPVTAQCCTALSHLVSWQPTGRRPGRPPGRRAPAQTDGSTAAGAASPQRRGWWPAPGAAACGCTAGTARGHCRPSA